MSSPNDIYQPEDGNQYWVIPQLGDDDVLSQVSWFHFLPVDFDAEDLERYAPGGLHPTHLGDIFDGR